jgi:hypothetical protein
VRTEILEVSAVRSGHFYLEREERDERRRIAAKADGRIWATRAPALRTIFPERSVVARTTDAVRSR